MCGDERTDKATFRVDAHQLAEAMGRLSRTGRQAAGAAAVIQLQADRLTIEWAGAHEELPGTGEGEACVSVPDKVITGLSHLLGGGTVTLVVAGERIRVGWISFACRPLDRMPPQLLAANATPLDVLLLGYRESPERIAEAGLTDEVARVTERVKLSVERAALPLDWLGISRATVEAWVKAHLQQSTVHPQGKR